MFERIRRVVRLLRGDVVKAFDEEEEPNEIRYGDGNTYQHSGEVNVEIGPEGDVVAVWYRCRRLPFTETRIDLHRVNELRRRAPVGRVMHIKAIIFEAEKA